ncbi:hypothetical protein DPMN_078390 [Dreissena polymorpha]|uniref:Uncharacterized protein n=1 Tax=Dreissena polymorpha TaxID=45954 RepID=A0A9D3YR10_DREPO|nr:hypothetical protein DPMN_078390 [Dreissena polymorpha]
MSKRKEVMKTLYDGTFRLQFNTAATLDGGFKVPPADSVQVPEAGCSWYHQCSEIHANKRDGKDHWRFFATKRR